MRILSNIAGFLLVLAVSSPGMAQQGVVPAETVRVIAPGRTLEEDLLRRGDRRIPSLLLRIPDSERLIAEGRYQEAIDLLEPLWRADPQDEMVSSSLKRAYRAMKNSPALIAVLRRQLDGKAGDELLLSELADAFFGAGSEDSARATIDRLIAVDPGDPARHQLAAKAFVRSGQYGEGIALYRRARIELADSLIFAEDMARLLEARREYRSAVDEYFRSLATLEPRKASKIHKRITNLTKIPEAAPQITAALHAIVERLPEDEYAHKLYADLLFESELIDSAFAEYRRADHFSDKPGAHRQVGIKRALETEHYGAARDEAVAFLADYPEHNQRAQILRHQAGAELGLGRPLVAIVLLQDLSGQLPASGERGEVEYKIGEIFREHVHDMDSARAHFRIVLEQPGSERVVHVLAKIRLGDMLVYHGDLAAADSTYQAAQETAPQVQRRLLGGDLAGELEGHPQEEIAYRRAELLFLSGSFEECAAQLKEFVKRNPKGLHVNDAIELGMIISEGTDAMNWSLSRYAAAHLALRQGQGDSALALFGVIAEDSANALADDAHFAIGSLHADAGAYAEAVTGYRALIARFPESFLIPRAWFAIGDLYEERLADPVEARAAYMVILSDFKESPVIEAARYRLQRLGVP